MISDGKLGYTLLNSLPVIDLFAGAGGLGIGAARAGADLRLSVDSDRFSCETVTANPNLHGGAALHADVTALTAADLRKEAGLNSREDVVVIGGAPCQPFSKAAYWVDKGDEAAYRRARARGEAAQRTTEPLLARPDSRRTLVNEFWRLTKETDAAAFVFENVPSILHPRNKHVFEALRQDAEAAGYFTRTVVATATDFGAPQARQRVFLLGSREAQPEAPAGTYFKEPDAGQLPWVTSGDALRRFEGDEYAEGNEEVTGTWASHLKDVPPGMNYKFHTAWAGHPNPTFETETRYWNFLLKLDPDRPSWTIPASPGPWTGPFHWSGRRLRIRELAALQTFPDGYVFSGPRREQVRQIGNAVPSVMAEQMVLAAMKSLSAKSKAA
ncbi:DNA cytosine methyltransferase [Salinibacterium sp. SWN139]|uniref:DNA cytosine methyltransferase n=1 Tax=Salinibacterium sp. SWN139 TaxID=2792055 RepID=UPI0018CF7831|nr:DNA cytosine methyltransferase [Salinibacterium sp. SWN139]MBH0054882.1 DNA cytosine methyltransferase [Salinibacterium sp. SWN139]